jgi:hypothetical protein
MFQKNIEGELDRRVEEITENSEIVIRQEQQKLK